MAKKICARRRDGLLRRADHVSGRVTRKYVQDDEHTWRGKFGSRTIEVKSPA